MGIGMDRLVMLLTGQESIQEVLFFPQMRPEKVAPRDKKEVFVAAGIPEAWVPVLHKAGYLTLDAVRAEEKPGRLLQQLQDIKRSISWIWSSDARDRHSLDHHGGAQ